MRPELLLYFDLAEVFFDRLVSTAFSSSFVFSIQVITELTTQRPSVLHLQPFRVVVKCMCHPRSTKLVPSTSAQIFVCMWMGPFEVLKIRMHSQ